MAATVVESVVEQERKVKMQTTMSDLRSTGPIQFPPHQNYHPFNNTHANPPFFAPPYIYPDFQTGLGPYFLQTSPYIPIHPLQYKLVSPQQENNLQEFQYFVVIDFEATCDKNKNPQPQEIIEFPSVLINCVTGQLEASFQTYVRPMYNQNLTEFCKELTGIQQIQVDRGVPLSEALLMHDKWLEDKGIKNKSFAVVTWSNWDCRVMLESECKLKNIRKPPYFNRWINLKVPFMTAFGGTRCNLKEAVQLAGLTWEGRAHCGLDDARNTARLMALMMHRGFKFSITNSLSWHPDCEPPPVVQEQQQRPPPVVQEQQQRPPPVVGPMVGPVVCTQLGGPVCFCGVVSSKNWVRRPGPTQGRCFFGCGNWTANRRAVCNYFVWAAGP